MQYDIDSRDIDQAISRIHRMTQNKQTFIHTVVIKDTVEEGLMDNVLRKKVRKPTIVDLLRSVYLTLYTLERIVPISRGG